MFERAAFVRAYRAAEDSLSALCRSFGISRKTAYKWLDRVEAEGEAGLEERSRAPHAHPNALAAEVEAAVLELRGAKGWGPKKLWARLRETLEPEVLPSVGTIANVLSRHGLVRARSRVRRATPSSEPLAHATACNRVWCIDFKGWFRTGDGCRVDPLTVTDAYSRYLLCCQAVTRPDGFYVQARLEAVFRAYGLPERIRSDNGAPFASTGLAGLSRLAVWWIRLGIVPERIEPGHPEQNGRHERFHLTLAQATATPPAGTPGAQQRRFDHFQREYNEERPHEALGQIPPARLYEPSPRPYPVRLPEPVYPDEYVTRRVRGSGQIKWAGHDVRVSEALSGQTVGLEALEDGEWRMHFGPVALGVFNERRGEVLALAAYTRRQARRARLHNTD